MTQSSIPVAKISFQSPKRIQNSPSMQQKSGDVKLMRMSESDLKIKIKSANSQSEKTKMGNQFETVNEIDEPKHLDSYMEEKLI